MPMAAREKRTLLVALVAAGSLVGIVCVTYRMFGRKGARRRDGDTESAGFLR
jgi:hypothetical protein